MNNIIDSFNKDIGNKSIKEQIVIAVNALTIVLLVLQNCEKKCLE